MFLCSFLEKGLSIPSREDVDARARKHQGEARIAVSRHPSVESVGRWSADIENSVRVLSTFAHRFLSRNKKGRKKNSFRKNKKLFPSSFVEATTNGPPVYLLSGGESLQLQGVQVAPRESRRTRF